MQSCNQASPLDILRTCFGYDAFRGHQEEIIHHVLSGGDAFVLMPTGSGKSICYQIPAMIRSGVGIVISPPIALMQDQVDAVRQLGIRAELLDSTLNPREARAVELKMVSGEIDLMYVAPERLLPPEFQQLLNQTPLALFAIDEAHCVSRWGHDFRPEYLQLSILPDRFPHIPRIALTAAADPVTRREIIEKLKLENARQQKVEVIRLLKEGKPSSGEIAKHVGISPPAVWAYKAHLTMGAYGSDKESRTGRDADHESIGATGAHDFHSEVLVDQFQEDDMPLAGLKQLIINRPLKMPTDSITDQRLRKIRGKYRRAYEPWSNTEDEWLLKVTQRKAEHCGSCRGTAKAADCHKVAYSKTGRIRPE